MRLKQSFLVKSFLILLLCIASVLITGCKKEDTPDEPTKIPTLEIEKLNYELYEGDSEKVITKIVDGKSSLEIIYESSNPKIANVQDGEIKAIAKGNVTIMAYLKDYDENKISLEVKVMAVPTVVIEGENEVYANHTIQLTSKIVSDVEITDKPVWSSSDNTIASVNDEGLVSGKVAGVTVISVKYGEYKGTFKVTVVKEPNQFVVNYCGGTSQELYEYIGNVAEYGITSYNGSFWASNNYASNIFISEKKYDPTATFSDRIYIGKNSETGYYEVVSILKSGKSSWPSDAEYVITISNSYGSFATVHTETEKISVGDVVFFNGDFKKASTSKPISAKFYAKKVSVDKVIYEQGDTISLPTATKLGNKFLGWVDENGNSITTAPSTIKGLINVYASWNEIDPVTALNVSEFSRFIIDGDEIQVVASVSPTNAYFTEILYSTSNKDIVSISDSGLIKAVNAGKAIITIQDYVGKFVYTYEIEVDHQPSIDITFSPSYKGVLKVNETFQLEPTLIGSATGSITYTSSDSSILSVDSSGLVTALKEGNAKITISAGSYSLEVGITVNNLKEEDKVDQVIKLIANNNFAVVDAGNVSLYDDGNEKYYAATYGSVNRYLFTDLVINEKYYATTEANSNNHQTRKSTDTIEFVCVHDTATLTGTSESIAQVMSSGETSIHYTVGNDVIWGVVPEKYIAYHAGDGTSTVFTWTNTNVKAIDNSAPIFTIVPKGSGYVYAVNGTITSIVVPATGDKQTSNDLLTYLGPTWKIKNGYYYMGLTWWSTTYQKIASHGGNNNSIGIEMNVNTTNDIYDTWQRTAKLVADILIRNNLDTTRVKLHNTFSGKNCAQDILSGDIWQRFFEMVTLEYELQSKYSDVKIAFKSNNPEIVGDDGRVINAPAITKTVSYDVTVSYGETSKTITLYSVIPGSTTWEQWSGTYASSVIWNNGKYCKYSN